MEYNIMDEKSSHLSSAEKQILKWGNGSHGFRGVVFSTDWAVEIKSRFLESRLICIHMQRHCMHSKAFPSLQPLV